MTGMRMPDWLKPTRSDPTIDWFQKLESRRGLVDFTVLFVVIAIIAATSLRLPWSYDLFWHLQMGKDWLENGLSPWLDHYSFTFNGEKILSPPIVFEAGIYYLVEWLGLETAVRVYKFAALSLTVLLTAYWLRTIRAPVVAHVLVLPLVAFLLQTRALARPELLGFSLLVLGIVLYQRALDAGRLSAKSMLPIVALMLLWTNYHGAILGYVLFFGLFVDYAFRHWRLRSPLREWIQWAAWGAAILAVGFVKPGFGHPVIEMLRFSSEWRTLIQEYLPPFDMLRMPATYAVIALALATLWLLARQRSFGYLVVCLVFVYNAATSARMMAPAGILVLCLFGLALRDLQPGIRLRSAAGRVPGAWAAAVWVVLILAFGTAVANARTLIRDNLRHAERFPSALVAYFRDSGLEGRIFNEYPVGGFLIHGLAGQAQVYIDGRTAILYPAEHFKRYEDALRSVDVLRSEIRERGIDHAVISNHATVARHLYATGEMGLDFVDAGHSLYRRENPMLPVMGFLWARPACWSRELAGAVQEEHGRALFNLPPYSPMLPFVDLVARYANEDDAERRIAILRSAAVNEEVEARFMAYRALENGDFDLAAAAFRALPHRFQEDLLAGAWAHTVLGHHAQAEEYLDTVTRRRLESVRVTDLLILHRLLRDIQAAGELRRFDESYLDDLGAQLRQTDPELLDAGITTGMFCASELPRFD